MTEKEKDGQMFSPEEAFLQINQVPLANVLIHAFRQYSNESTWQMVKNVYGPKIAGFARSLQGEDDRRYLTIEKFYNDARFKIHLYRSTLEEEPAWGELNFTAGVKETGTWAAGRGNQQTFGINAWFSSFGGFNLPSRNSKWLFEIATNVARLASELHDPIQPHFWDQRGVDKP